MKQLITAGAFALMALLSVTRIGFGADYASAVLAQKPVGYWPLNENTPPPEPAPADNLGSLDTPGDGYYLLGTKLGEPGALTGNSATSTRFYNPDLDITYGGSKVEVPFNAALNPTGAFSVEFWAKPRQKVNDAFCPVASINSDHAIGASTNSDPRSGWIFYLNTNAAGDNEWQFRLGNAGSPSDLPGAPPAYLDGDAIRGGIAQTGVWSHVVGTFDRTNATLYVDGKAVASRRISGYRANDARAFRIGTTCFEGILGPPGNYFGNRGFDGWIEEVAFYGSALSAADISAHYAAGQSNGANYSAVVLANQPIGYWRLGEPGNPAAVNLGTLGSEVDGEYDYGTQPGKPGPRPTSFPGFSTDNLSPQFSGTQGFIQIPALNLNTNTVTMTAWIYPTEVEANDAGVVFCRAGTTVAGLKFDLNDPNGLSYNWNAASSAANFKSGLTVPVGKWSFVALIVQPDQAALCLQDGTQFTSVTNYTAHPVQRFEGPTLLGTDIQDSSLTFHGNIDEVAIFNRALSVGEVYSQYAAAAGGLQPKIFADPRGPGGPIYDGQPLVLKVDAGGTPPLTYQWRKNGAAISGAASDTYALAEVSASNNGDYDVVISNAQGEATSQKVTVAVQPLAQPAIVLDPLGRSMFQGGTLSLSVQATGGGLSYQWQHNGTNVPGATNATFTVASTSASDSGTYRVTASNRAGTAQSGTTTVQVTVPAAGSYEEAVVADEPEAWWRLGEEPGTVTLIDALARHDGTYKGSVNLGAPGALKTSQDTGVSFDGSAAYGEVPFSPELNTTNFTIECWVKADTLLQALTPVASFTQPPGRGYLLLKSEDGHWQYLFGNGIDTPILVLDGSDVTYDEWTHLVLTYDGTAFRGYVNGQLDIVAQDVFTPNNVAPFRIGFDQPGSGWNDYWNGSIDEVAYYSYALPSKRIAAHYAAGLYPPNTKPVFVRQPASASAVVGSAFYFDPAVEGSAPLQVQWNRNGTPIEGETNLFLLRPSVDFSDTGVYQLKAQNAAGETLSDPVTLAVVPVPEFANVTNGLVLHLAFDGDFRDSSGHGNDGTAAGAPTFVAGAIGKNAVHCSTTVDASDPNDPVVQEANYVSLGTPADLQFGADVDFSISYWVRFTGTPGDLPFFSNALNSYGNPGYTFAPSYQQGGWSWSLGDNESGEYIGTYSYDSINDGAWHHLVHTFHRAGSARTYLDSYFVDTRSIVPLGDIDSGEPTNIGQDSTGSYPEAGELDIDDFAVWRRVLTPFEVATIYAAGQEGVSFDTTGNVSLAVTRDAGRVQLVWQAGSLQEAASAIGPWSTVTAAKAPYYQLSPDAPQRFYRVRLSP